MPLPSSVNDWSASSRLRASSERLRSLPRISRLQYARCAAAADATAQLIELRESEGLGAVDEHGVGARDVEAALDDRGAEQHVRFTVQEAQHAVFEVVFGHLAVRDQHAHFGNDALEQLRDLADRVDAVVHVEYLSAAAHSRRIASRTIDSEKRATWVRIERRSAGGVWIATCRAGR